MTKRILLVGGDEFRASCAGMDRHVLQTTGNGQPRVAIVPTAAAFENPGLAASNGARHFTGLGASAFQLDVVRREDAENPRIVSQLDGCDVIYFTGGSPEHLHSVLADSALFRAVDAACEAGAVWAGSSAGAMVLGAVMRRPSPGAPVSPALDVVPDVMVLPHHERSDPHAVIDQLSGIATLRFNRAGHRWWLRGAPGARRRNGAGLRQRHGVSIRPMASLCRRGAGTGFDRRRAGFLAPAQPQLFPHRVG